jgi:hypothetical protein
MYVYTTKEAHFTTVNQKTITYYTMYVLFIRLRAGGKRKKHASQMCSEEGSSLKSGQSVFGQNGANRELEYHAEMEYHGETIRRYFSVDVTAGRITSVAVTFSRTKNHQIHGVSKKSNLRILRGIRISNQN